MKFLIVSPRQTSGGAIVLHILCKLLMDHGHDAKIFYTAFDRKYPISYATFLFDHICFLRHDIPRRLKAQLFPKAKFTKKPRYNGYAYFPVKGCQQKYLPTIDDETIVIYPEIVYGNPLCAKKTIYWLLFFNPYKGDANAYAKDALIFTYHELFNDETLNPFGRKLYLQALDEDMWKQTNFGERSGCCYIVHKGHDRADLPKQFDGPVIDKLSKHEIAEILNQKKYCYCYDMYTSYSLIAAMCGCIPIVMLEEGKTRTDCIGKEEEGYGIAWGNTPEAIEYALATREKMFERVHKMHKENDDAVDSFLVECKRYFYPEQGI